MKVVIVSDSHGLTKELDLLKRVYSDADVFIHCGDSELDVHHPSITGFHTVRGNCDWKDDFPEELVLTKDHATFYIAHGHLLNVKSSLTEIKYRAFEKQANIACFGHSHLVGAELIDGKLFLNPGSIRLPRGRKEPTYLLLTLNGTNAHVKLMDIDQFESPLEEHPFLLR